MSFEPGTLKHPASDAPLTWMLLLLLTPAICFSCGMVLVDASKRQRLSLVEWWALVAAFLPVTLGTLLAVWITKGLLAMSLTGI